VAVQSKTQNPKPKIASGGRFAVERKALIQLEDVYKSFGPLAVLRGVTLNVYAGETLCIIGMSGCGKTVALKHMIGLMDPDSGRVRFDGRDLAEMTPRERVAMRTRFGMVFQGGALFDSMDVAENVAFPLREHTSLSDADVAARVRDKLSRVGLEDAGALMSADLSGGMRKRVALARAIALDPEVVLYDEPTTGLDPVTADVINELILRTQRALKTTSVVVTHDMAGVYKVADRVVMLHEGRLVIDGTPAEIRATADPIVRGFIEGRAET
jgi:phospholipid/cholesterol/gamma-HCH transport system ATP-binding protein